jgi:hypothetical protein
MQSTIEVNMMALAPDRDFHDGCIGFRVVMAEPRPSARRSA